MNEDQLKQIRRAIEIGNQRYWDDATQQDINYNKWKENNCEGLYEVVNKGSIIDYIFEAVKLYLLEGEV